MYKILYNKIMKVGIFCNRSAKRFTDIRRDLLRILEQKNISYEVYYSVDEIGAIDILFVLGGDGTILKVAIEAGRKNIKLIGINAGNLGFLTEFEGEQIEEAVDLIHGQFQTDKRTVLEVCVGDKHFYALNDVVFQRNNSTEADNNVVSISTEIDGNKVDSFIGDGIIVSTPTGSTAYSLSAGGSVLAPGIDAFILTPICAHSLHNRPIVYSDHSIMHVLLEKDAVAALFCDGSYICNVTFNDAIFIQRAAFDVTFISRPDSNFFAKLLYKLNKWS